MAQKILIKGLGFQALSIVQKVMFADFALFKNWWGHLNTIFVLAVGISTNQSLKVQIPGELPGKRGGGCRRFQLIDVLVIKGNQI